MTKKNKSRIGFIGSIASIIGLILYFIPNSSNSISTSGNNSPVITSPEVVNIVNNNYYESDITIPKEIEQSSEQKEELRKQNVNYRVKDDIFSSDNKLFADVDGQTYVLIEDEEICFEIEAVKDFDNNGTLDVLVTNVTGCGGNCCGNSFFFYSYSGDGHFARSEEFGYSWNEPKIEKWKDSWCILVTSHNEGINQLEHEEIKERYILDYGKAIKVEETERKELVSLTEMKSDDFDFEKDETKAMFFDLDNDGVNDKIEGRLWHRWGRVLWRIEFSSGKTFENGIGSKRIGVLKSKTNGVHDIVSDLDDILKWNGLKYK